MSNIKQGLTYLSGVALSLFSGCATPDKQIDLLYPEHTEQRDNAVEMATATTLSVSAQVQDAQKRYTVTLTKASSSDSAVVEAKLQEGVVALRALKPGEVTIDIDGQVMPGEQEVTQQLKVQVHDVAEIKLQALEAAPLYLIGQRVELMALRLSSTGQRLVGEGAWPLSFPEGVKLLGTSFDQANIVIMAPDAPGSIVIKSTLDAQSLELPLIEPSQIDGLHLEAARALKVGERESFKLSPLKGTQQVHQAQLDAQATSSSPQLCTAQTEVLDGLTMLVVEALSPGRCEIEVSFKHPKQAQPIKLQQQITIEP